MQKSLYIHFILLFFFLQHAVFYHGCLWTSCCSYFNKQHILCVFSVSHPGVFSSSCSVALMGNAWTKLKTSF